MNDVIDYQVSPVLRKQLAALATLAHASEGLDLNPKMSKAIQLGDQGQHAQAESLFKDILKQHPQLASAHHNLAVCFIHQSRFNEAETSLREGIRFDPNYSRAFHTLGNLLQKLGRLQEAEQHLRKSLGLDPNSAEALNDLGVVLNGLKRYGEATIVLEQAVRIRPDLVDAHNNLGVSLTSLGKLNAASRSLKRALDLNPQFAAAHSNLGNVHKEAGRLDAAIACYDFALQSSPTNASTRWNRSLALLQKGAFEHGWTEYEWRWKRGPQNTLLPNGPLWQGESMEGKTILLYAEQGLGDTIQFIRYASMLRCSGARVIFACPRPLWELLSQAGCCDLVFAEDEQLPSYDVHAPLMSLPRLFQTRLDTVPSQVPYIQTDRDRVAYWKQKVEAVCRSSDFRVGISWQGNPHHAWDHFRSAPLHEWDNLAKIPNVKLFSLQSGPGLEQTGGPLIISHKLERLDEPGSGMLDFADVAAIIENIDLVITVDTAVAHLAGALGRNVWILLAKISDWRWLDRRPYSPWYPTARLFRQKRLNSWAPVFRSVEKQLRFTMGAVDFSTCCKRQSPLHGVLKES